MMNGRPSTKRIGLFGGASVLIALLVTGLLILAPSMRAAAAGAAPITLSFDHLSTGFELDGVHRDLPCEQCHLNAVFKGTPRNCGICHITGSVYNATPKTQTHVQSSNNCAACHNTISFRPDVHFDHREVMGSCVSCHNGTIAQGKDPKIHPQSSDACDACHTVMSWNPPKAVDHTQIPLAVQGFCIICHNGTSATGKNKGHLVTSLECGDCHLTTTWLGAAFDHTGIRTGCFSCHNGTKAVGKQGNHMPTSNTCEACHTTGIGTAAPNWVPSLFDHTQMPAANTCLPCHSGTVKISTGFVSGLPANHVPLSSATPDCVLCHGNNPAAETWMVLAADIATLHTKLNTTNCLMCHSGATFAGVPAPYIPMAISGVSPYKKAPLAPPHIPVLAGTDCSACHGIAYQAGGFGPATAMSAAKHAFVSSTCDLCHDTGKSFYVGSGTPLQLRPADHIKSTVPAMATGDCSACHNTTDWTSTTMPAGHMPNPSNLMCATCHVSAPNDYTPATLAANSVLHTGVTGNCGLCHGDAVTQPVWANNYTPANAATLAPSHIPYLAGTDCSSCHSSTTYAVGTFGPMIMNAAKHAFVPTACDTCHEKGVSFYMGKASPPLQGRPADHTSGQLLTGDCSGCHNTTDWTSNVMPAGHMPNPGAQLCSVCHTNPANYATLASDAVLHTGITTGCGQCHGEGTQLDFYRVAIPAGFIKATVPLTPSHIPYTSGTDCSSCHASKYVAGGFGPATAMSAATHAFVPAVCTTCHDTGKSFYTGAALALQLRPADHIASGDAQQQTGDCGLCHNTTDWKSQTLPIGHMPNPGAQACAVCHTAITSSFASYATITMNMTVMHTGITGNCGQCHGSPSGGALTFYNNNDNPKAAVLIPVHIPYLSSADCSSCHVVGATFGPTNMSAAKHAFVPGACNTCHEAGLTFYMGASTPTLQGRPASHLTSGNPQEVSGDCSGCHNTTDWTSTAKPGNHMPTPGTQTCSVCHTAIGSTEASYATLASIPVLHTGVTGNCSQCHGSYTAPPLTWYNNYVPKDAILTPSHIPYLVGSDCSSCHASNYVTGGFGPTNMSPAKHAFVPTTCDTCHDGAATFYLGASTPQPLQKRPPTHISAPNPASQASGDCSLCHNTTSWNATAAGLPNKHMPIPGTQSCPVCHLGTLTSDPNSYANMAPIPVLHTGITTGCAQCHGVGPIAIFFYNGNDPPKPAVANHIPSLTGNDCSACHTANYTTGGFGPMNMTQATHTSVSNLTCVTCHEAGRSFFMGAANPGLQTRPANHSSGAMLTADCSNSGCHTTANWLSSTLPPNHMPNPANTACNTCHVAAPTNYTTLAASPVMHTGISGNCGQCHGTITAAGTWYNNYTLKGAAGLAAPHIPYISGVDCTSCHSPSTYAVGAFGPMNMTQTTHAFVPSTCNTCHGTATVSFYMGAANPGLQLRPADHNSGTMLTGDCSGCHTTANWNSNSMPAGHMPNPGNQACAVCHIGATATPANYALLAANSVLHTGITGNCIQCHGTAQLKFYNNNDNPVPQIANHMTYVAGTDCNSCHKTSTYAAGSFAPMNMTQATHAFVATTCVTCHGTATVSFYMGPAANPGLQLRPADHSSGTMLTSDCNVCHTTANWNSTALPAGHMPNPGNLGCNTCHTGAPANYATMAANSVMHTGITNNCLLCHSATTTAMSFYNGNDPPKPQVANHIPYLTGTDCGSCHKTTTYAAGAFGPMNMSQATHAFVTTTCTNCHEKGLSFFMGGANPGLQGRPPDHSSGTMLTGNCGGCHTTANWNSTSGALPAGHMPNPGNQGCSVCHTAAPANYTTMASNAVLHTGISSNCITCHGQTQLSFYNNNDNPKPMVAGHIPSAATPCESCHSGFTTFSGTTMSAAKHTLLLADTGGTCDQCHEIGKSFFGVNNLTVRPSSGHGGGNDCNGCHSPNGWGGGGAKKKAAAAPATTKTTVGIVANTGLAGRSVNSGLLGQSGVQLPVGGPVVGGATGTGGTVGLAGSAASAIAGATPMPGITRVDHAGVVANCFSCHNGVLAAGKGPLHIASNNTCENCHTTLAWMPAHFDHRGVTATCSSCHNGVTAPGKPTRHIQTNQDCSACHGTLAWAPATFNHLGINATCQSCHNGVAATAKQIGHIPTTLDCGSCHSTLNWTTTITSAPQKPLISRPKPSPRPPGASNGPVK